MNANHRVFLQWFMLCLTFVVTAFFAWYYGLIGAVWKTDVTYMTSVIGTVFVATCGYLGLASWRYDDNSRNWRTVHSKRSVAIADTNIGRTAAFVVTLTGLLGTAIGLMFQVKAMGSLDLSNPQNIVGFIAAIGAAMGTALYATASGIIACIGITLLNSNIEYFIDRDEG